jgi:hypothetical protein
MKNKCKLKSISIKKYQYFIFFFFSQIKDYSRLNRDIKIMREMLNHYESIINEKHQTEKNLNKALDLLYNKTITYHRYYEWRVDCIEKKREKYALSLAKHFYEEKIKRVG